MAAYAILESIWTVVLLVSFIAIFLWAWSGKRKASFEEAARMALDEDSKPGREDIGS